VRLVLLVSAACAAAAMFALGGCGTGGYVEGGSQGTGRELFRTQCGSCHVLADANTPGTIGPNLDDAFAQARADGMTDDTFAQVVATQIKYPIEETSTGSPGMPGPDQTLPECDDVEEGKFCVEDRDEAVESIAAYVAAVSGTEQPPREPPAEEPGGEPAAVDGREIFTANCASCHTLADAGTSGTIGPNLDQSRPSKDLAVERVTNGMGAMPPFRDTLSPQQIEAVAEYVARSAGG
jgi:mono/diheme cytochrome c family protein